MDKSSAMLTQKPAKACYDAQISYDIVPLDYLETAEKNNGRFGRGYKYLVVPACKKLPERFAKICEALKNAGVPVFFVDHAPDCENISENEIVPLQKLAAHIKESGLAHEYNAKEHLLRTAKRQASLASTKRRTRYRRRFRCPSAANTSRRIC